MVIYLLLFQTTLRNGNGMKKGKGEMELNRCKKLEPLSQIFKQSLRNNYLFDLRELFWRVPVINP